MRQHVTAILLAHGGTDYLRSTLDGIAAQHRRPDAVTVVGLGSIPGYDRLPPGSLPSSLVAVPRHTELNEVVERALSESGVVPSALPPEAQWIWLLRHDNTPQPQTLAALLEAVERSPSVMVAAPKQMDWDAPDVIAEFGRTLSEGGVSVVLAAGELDQGQFDTQSDVMAADLGGLLIRRDLWQQLGGIDPVLEDTDAGLDFGVRARRAGARVSLVPEARVARHPRAALLGRSRMGRARAERLAQLHRRLAYAPAWALLPLWLSLLPTAVLRSVGHLLGKRPGRIAGEFAAALTAAVRLGAVARARAVLKARSRLSWSALVPLRQSTAERRQLRQIERDHYRARMRGDLEAPAYFTGGGLLSTIAAAAIGLVAVGPLLGSASISGGGLLPLGSLAELWRGAGWTAETLAGVPADPFHTVLAVLGSLVPWAPSLAVVAFYLAALPLAAAGAWFLASRLSPSPSARAVAALVWAVAPMLLSALAEGRLGAALAHVLLPWLMFAAQGAVRSWASAGAAGLLLAAVIASAPSLLPALAVLYVLLLVLRVRAWHRILLIALPAVALSLPLVLWQLAALSPLSLAVDPGVPLAFRPASAWQLALGFPEEGLGGWLSWLGTAGAGLPTAAIAAGLALVLAPLGVSAVLALFRRGSTRAALSLLGAALGLVTAVAAGQIAIQNLGSQAVPLWPGAGLSLYWLGILAAAVIAWSGLRGAFRPTVIVLGAVLAVIPLLASFLLGAASVRGGAAQVPAIVTAQAALDSGLGTLVLRPEADGVYRAELIRGVGGELGQWRSAAEETAPGAPLPELTADLVAGSGAVAAELLDEQHIGFVLLREAEGAPSGFGLPAAPLGEEAEQEYARTLVALDANPLLARVSETSLGVLWRTVEIPSGTAPTPEWQPNTPLQNGLLAVQLLVLLATLILAIPTRRSPSTLRSAAPERSVRSREREQRAVRRSSGAEEAVIEESIAEEVVAEPAAAEADTLSAAPAGTPAEADATAAAPTDADDDPEADHVR